MVIFLIGECYAKKISLFYFIVSLIFSFNVSAGVDFTDPSATPVGSIPDLSGTNANTSQISTDFTGQYVYVTWERNNIIQTSMSHDFGQTWISPTTTPTGSVPNLSLLGFQPQIITASGRYVYAIWNKGAKIETATSQDFGVTWINPMTTPQGSPALSGPGPGNYPQITTNSTGQYVYSIWWSVIGASVAISTDYGMIWKDPTTTPPGTTNPSIAMGSVNVAPQITTDSSGKHVYAIWGRGVFFSATIQVARSEAYGDVWKYPTSTPLGTPDLTTISSQNKDAQITTNSTGQHVYAIWRSFSGPNKVIQVAISNDYGDIWNNPATTLFGTPNLAQGTTAEDPQISTDSSGKYVYAIWEIDDIVQIGMSRDYGETWINPTTTPTGTSSPNLSLASASSNTPQIITDSTGRYVYGIWESDNVVQIAISEDFGDTWINPTSTPPGTISPNLSDPGGVAVTPQFAIDGSGKHVYTTWSRDNAIQTAIGTNFDVSLWLFIRSMQMVR